jgi:branched-chain amino acid transport system ATP-binding protein
MLDIKNLSVNYGEINILEGVELKLGFNKSIIIKGFNGCGKSTLLRAIYNLIPIKSGRINFNGENITGQPSSILLQKGISYIPQEMNVFSNLTIKENIFIGNHNNYNANTKKEALEYVFDNFPIFKKKENKLGRSLSGGQSQLLALARVLLDRPKLILLDEPTLGLSEKNTHLFLKSLIKIKNKYKISLIIVEHNFEQILPIVDDVYILNNKNLKLNN